MLSDDLNDLFDPVLQATRLYECKKCRREGGPPLFTERGAWLHQVTFHPEAGEPPDPEALAAVS